MACKPCQERAKRMAEMSSARKYESSLSPEVRAAARNNPNEGCLRMYDELTILDRNLIEVYRRVRRVGDIGYRLQQMQREIRAWIRDLRTTCPDEERYNVYKEYINSEYAKYYSDPSK